ncbi:hypothetical protein [Sphingomonas floccifaciens]
MGAPSRATMFHPNRPIRVRRLMSALSPDEIGDAIEALIARLDALDGDLDYEVTGAEDDFMDHGADGPGCPVADTDHCDAGDDNPYRLYGDDGAGDPDDAEEDDVAEDDDPGGTEIDYAEGVGHLGQGLHSARPRYGIDQRRPPLNYGGVEREYRAALAGLTKTADGRWSLASASPR